MHFFKALLIGASALTVALAQDLSFTGTPDSVTAGSPVDITYTAPDLNAPVTITLRKGNPDDLGTVGVLTSSATGGTYTWIPDVSLADGEDYALQITQGNSINYSRQFSVSGGSPAAQSSAAAATTSSEAAAASVTASVSVSQVLASLSSVISAANSSITAIAGNGTTTTMLPSNMTISSATLRTTTATTTRGQTGASATTGGASSTSTSSTVPSNVAVANGAPMALILGAVAAMAYLN